MGRWDYEFDDWLRDNYAIAIADVSLDPVDVMKKCDPDAYRDKSLEWSEERDELLLATLDVLLKFKANSSRFHELKKKVQRGLVVPFIGAGLSVPCGLTGWREFLSLLILHLDVPSASALAALEMGDLEAAAEAAALSMGGPLFEEQVEAHLNEGDKTAIRGAVLQLPSLFDGPCVTTNLDRILETTYINDGIAFEDVIQDDIPESFGRLLRSSRRMLLKIHGDRDLPESWVLRFADYEKRYGPRGSADLDLPLPHALRLLYTEKTLLFIGCSLLDDRTLDIFRTICTKGSQRTLPRHYALAERPDPADGSDWDDRERFLTGLNIFPIWFEHRDFESIFAVLLGLAL